MKSTKIEKLYCTYLFNNNAIKKYLTKKDYKSFVELQINGGDMSGELAKKVASAMKDWAIAHGCTHYTHLFLPLTGKTAEKQISFIEIEQDGKVIECFSENSLIKGEADASSLPNGGERMNFEARGYTVWDYTSPAFIYEDLSGNKVLCIPTAYCSFNGDALDEKTPLLRAMHRLDVEATRVLNLIGYKDVRHVNVNVGCEQEYFLIDAKDIEKRKDLKFTGRTLLGANDVLSQEYTHNYYGEISSKVSAFMNDLNYELWRIGVTAKIQHNEVAPSQHELVPIYTTVNIASDQNMMTMKIMKKVAEKHGLCVLFHEKPFDGVNGSGKHNNWSISTDTGINLLDSNNDSEVFLLFFTSLIASIDEFAPLIQMSASHAGNDRRLGGDEAPPTIISVHIGDDYLKVLEAIAKGEKHTRAQKSLLDIGVDYLPKTFRDVSDRNRTSPFAFTGNKFEFRMVGSSQSVALPNVVLCTILANKLNEIALKLEKAEDVKQALNQSIIDNFIEHKKIIFNGNGYDSKWHEEAKNRGLKWFDNAVDAIGCLEDDNVREVFTKMNVLRESEIKIRQNAEYSRYFDSIIVEANILLDMLFSQVLPSLGNMMVGYCENLNKCYSEALNTILQKAMNLEMLVNKYTAMQGLIKEKAVGVRDEIIPLMEEIRKLYDGVERYFPIDKKPFPNYVDLIYKV